MHSYPGLGLSLWYHPQDHGEFYPTGHHENCLGSESRLLVVREVAMMHIMDRLTDKVDWHRKVFDDEIVDKWRIEALAYPDEALWELAVTSTSSLDLQPIKGIMTKKIFDYVCRYNLLKNLSSANILEVYPGAPRQSTVFRSYRHYSHPRCHSGRCEVR